MAMHTTNSTRPLPQLCGSHAVAGRPSLGLGARVRSSFDLEIELEVIGLFNAHRSRLLAYITTIGVAGHDGEEIVQEVFLALFRHLRMGKSRSNLRGWIFKVAHNLALRQREANQRWCSRMEADLEMDKAPDLTLNPEERLMAWQRQSRLLSVVSALPEPDRLCFNLRAEGLRYREIAEVLGISLGSVSLSLTRTVARLMRADEGRREGMR